MQTFVTIIHVLVSIFLILVVLLQSGRAGGMGAAMGGSSSGVFGARGAGNFLTKTTGACAILFMLTSMTLSIMSSKVGSVVQSHAVTKTASPEQKDADLSPPPSAGAAPALPAASQPAP